MKDAGTARDRSSEALDRMHSQLSRLDDAQELETELQTHLWSQQCLREMEEEERLDRTEHLTTEVLEVVASPAAGAVSLWKTKGGFPIGGLANTVVGGIAKAVSALNPKDRRGLRVAGRVGKVFLHSEISIITRNLLEGEP